MTTCARKLAHACSHLRRPPVQPDLHGTFTKFGVLYLIGLRVYGFRGGPYYKGILLLGESQEAVHPPSRDRGRGGQGEQAVVDLREGEMFVHSFKQRHATSLQDR